MQEVVTELGGEEFDNTVTLASASDYVLPNPAAYALLENSYPGSAERAFARAEEMQRETHERELP
jgi:hypothetical protein